jgi:catechol 2,3-dioxygenase-like lactoylglutathione lyase family enzyme
MTMAPGDLFEIGLIVPNLEESIEYFHQAFGYTFSPIVEGVLPNRGPEGDRTPQMRMAVSREHPQIELMETMAGTSMIPPAGTGLHHLGYYVDDLAGESERLAGLGLPFVRSGLAGDTAPAGWVYHQMTDGTLIEIVDRQTAPLRQALMRGEVPDSPMVHRVIHQPEGLGV